MSETTTEQAPETTPPAEQVADTTSTETQTTTEAPVESTDPETDAAPKPTQSDRRFAQLTKRMNAESAARKAAEDRATAAEALLNAGKETDTPKPPAQGNVEEAAARLVQQREFDRQRAALVANGTKEYGDADWNTKTDVLHSLGATSNPAFLEALVELPNATKIVAALADDADALVELLNKSPTQMAAKLGRMDAEMERTTAAPVRPLSNAPKPTSPISGGAANKEPDIYDESLPMKEWVELWDKRQAARRAARR